MGPNIFQMLLVKISKCSAELASRVETITLIIAMQLRHSSATHRPGVGAVLVENVELSRRDELAAVDSRLNGAEAAQNAHLLDVADDRRDVEPLQLGVDGVKTSDKVLEEQLERLRQADQLSPVDLANNETTRLRSGFSTAN